MFQMQEIKLLRYHCLMCPRCGTLRVGSGKTGKCFNEECGHTWALIDKIQGGTRGVLYSAWRPQEATAFIKQEKERMEK